MFRLPEHSCYGVPQQRILCGGAGVGHGAAVPYHSDGDGAHITTAATMPHWRKWKSNTTSFTSWQADRTTSTSVWRIASPSAVPTQETYLRRIYRAVQRRPAGLLRGLPLHWQRYRAWKTAQGLEQGQEDCAYREHESDVAGLVRGMGWRGCYCRKVNRRSFDCALARPFDKLRAGSAKNAGRRQTGERSAQDDNS